MIEDIIRSVLGMAPGAKKINLDLAAMRQHCKPIVEQLIPWEEEKELELLSLNVNYMTQKRGLDKIVIGAIQSIYYEPMVVFAYKDYVKGQRDALLYCRTKHLEYIYRLKRRDTDVYFNGKHVAVLDQAGILHGMKSKQTLGGVRSYSSDLLSIIVQGKDVGHMFNPSRPHNEQQRAFFVMSKLDDEEEYILLSLGLFELVTRLLANKKKK
jgi:hypothetical protein